MWCQVGANAKKFTCFIIPQSYLHFSQPFSIRWTNHRDTCRYESGFKVKPNDLQNSEHWSYWGGSLIKRSHTALAEDAGSVPVT